MKGQKDHSLYSRRRFLGTVMFSAAAASLLGSCNNPYNWQIGIYTRPWNKENYLVAFDEISKAGFEYVGLMSHKGGRVINQDTSLEVAEKIASEANARALNILSISGHRFMKNQSVEENIAALKRLIDNAEVCKCPNLMLNGISDPNEVDNYYKTIEGCCDYAASKGVEMNLKPHGGTNATGAQLRKQVEAVGHPNFSLWYDPGNIYYYSDGAVDPVEDVKAVAGAVRGMCVKDFKMPKDVNVTPGTGMVDFPNLFEEMKRGGFTSGPLIIECLNLGEISYITAEAEKAKEYLESILA